MTKICTKCKIEQDITNFWKDKNKSDGLSCWCIKCQKEYNENRKDKQKQWYEQNKKQVQEYRKVYKEQNKEHIKEYQKKYDNENRDKRLKRQKEYNDSHKNERQKYYYEVYREISKAKSKNYREEHKEELKAYNKKYREEHKEELKTYDKQRNQNNKLYRCMSRGIWHSLQGAKFEQKWEVLVPYTLQELKLHLESQFTPEMNWDNYGEYWEIDHIIPQNLLKTDNSNNKEFQICWSLMNLRPLEKHLNRSRPKDGSDILNDLKQAILNQKL